MTGGETPTLAGSVDALDQERLALTGTVARTKPGAIEEHHARGAIVGRYVVIALIGVGGMGAVYAAYDPELDRRVALKVLLAQDPDRAASVRLLREAQALARLNHPNVVAIHDVGTVGDRVFIAMELVDGVTLTRWLRAERRSWREVVAALVDAGRGLQVAHEVALVHRDFKPDNVMVGSDRRVRVTDFGLARTFMAERDASAEMQATAEESWRPISGSSRVCDAVTALGAMVGTPAYMAPEQWRGEAADARSDQYSFCVVAWEALLGQRPFAGATVAELAAAVLDGTITEPRGHGAPSWLIRLLRRGLSRDREQRFPDIGVLLAEMSWDPAPARRRWIGAGALSIALGGAVVFAGYREQRRTLGCERDGEAIASTWDHAARARVRDALVATGLANAASIAAKAEARLDDYAAQWHDARIETCLVDTGERPLDAALADAQRECLDERRDALAQVIEILVAADASIAQRTINAVTGLPLLSECSDVRWLAQRPVPSDDPEIAATVARERSNLRRALSLHHAGRNAEGQQLAARAFEVARELAHRPLLAEAGVRAGQLDLEIGELDRAASELRDGALMAGELGNDVVAIDGLVSLVHLLSARRHDHATALVWAGVAGMMVGRLGDATAGLHASNLATALGETRYAAGDYESAIAEFARALAIREEILGDDHPDVARALVNLGVARHAAGDGVAAVADIRRALETFESALGSDHPELARTLNNLGVLLKQRGDYDEAAGAYERALDIRRRVLGDEHPDVAQSLQNLASLDESRGAFDDALVRYRVALELLERALGAQSLDVASARQGLAVLLGSMGEHAAALEHAEAALRIRRDALPPGHRDLGFSLNGIGEIRLALGQPLAAENAYREALAIFADDPISAYPSSGLGEALIELGRAGEAILLLERARELLPEALAPERATVDFSLARARWDLGIEKPEAVAKARAAAAVLHAAGPKWTESAVRVDAWTATR